MEAFSRPDFADGVRLAHLDGPAAGARQALAAHFLRQSDHIVELGGAGLPITRFLTHRPRSVLVVDPKIEPWRADALNGAPCRVEHVAAKAQAVAFDLAPGTYALVMLGLSLKPFGARAALDETVLRLVDGAALLIIEFAPARDRSAAEAPILLGRPGFETLASIDMRIEDTALRGSPFTERRLRVLVARN